ncbi:MAG: DMT family transporter [Xanthomonadales bacterium]|nr:DMT family transporter [Xanthomonadales bacterium]
MGLGEWLSLGSAVVWAIAVVMFKRSGETFSPTALNLLKNIIAAVLLAATLPIVYGLTFPTFSATEWWIMVASGLLGIAAADNLYFAALRRLGASRTGIASSLFSPSVIVLSYFLLGERLVAQQIAGFLLVVAAVILVSYRKDRKDIAAEELRQGTLLAVTAVFLMALGIVIVKPVLELHPFLWIVEIRVVVGIIGIVLVGYARDRLHGLRLQLRLKHNWWLAGGASFFGSYLAMILWLGGYKYTQASVASVLNETAAIFIVVLAWIFLGESLNARKTCGVLLSFAGVLLMVSA